MLEILGTIGFDWRVAIANLVSFLIIFWILKKWVFGPVGNIISERRAKIEQGLNNAQASEEVLNKAQDDAEGIIKEAKGEARDIVSKAHDTASEMVARAEGDAQAKADGIIADANDSIEKTKQQVEKELFEKTAGLVALGVQKILDEDMDDKKNASVSKRALEMMKDL